MVDSIITSLLLLPFLTSTISILPIGEWQTIWNWTENHCNTTQPGGIDNPNNSPIMFLQSDNTTIEFLDSSAYGFYQKQAYNRNLSKLNSICNQAVIESGDIKPNALPNQYNNSIWIQSTWREVNNPSIVHALIHNEFDGAIQSNKSLCPSQNDKQCFYWNCLCAKSIDGGNTFHLYNNITERACITVPYKYVPDIGAQTMSPSINILQTPQNDGYVYVWIGRHIPQIEEHDGFCLWRSNDLNNPMNWRAASWKYVGNKLTAEFNIKNFNPYYSDQNVNITQHICEINPTLSAVYGWNSWSWNTVLNKYLFIGLDVANGNLAYSVSDDMFNWSRAEIIMTLNNTMGKQWVYPALIDAGSKGVNFEYTNKNPWLIISKGNQGVQRDIVNLELIISAMENI